MRARSTVKLWPRHPQDWYCDPAFIAERLFDLEQFEGTIIDPACGRGNIIETARSRGFDAYGYDVVLRTDMPGVSVQDFMDPCWCSFKPVDNIVSNPPFGLCDEKKVGTQPTFVELALRRAARKVALLMPATWHQADKRSRWLETTPLRRIYHITPRPAMPPGDFLAAGGKAGNGTTDFAFYIFLKGYDGPVETRWLRRDP